MYQLVYTYSTHVSWVTELYQESLLVRVGPNFKLVEYSLG